MSVVKDLFTERFRPKTLNNLIIPERTRRELEKGLIQHLLLYGSPGTGKTSSLFILKEDHPYMYVDASNDGRVETIREDISEFCSSGIDLLSGKDNLKCVILDELDGASEKFFKAIRPVIEKYAKTARFIASCNYIHKIPEPVQSRFRCISYDPINIEEEAIIKKEYVKRIKLILDAAKIEASPDILTKFVDNDYPDMRTLLNKVQSFYNQGLKELDPKLFNINYNYEDLFSQCLNSGAQPFENYKLIVTEYASRIDEALTVLGTDFPEYIKVHAPHKIEKLPLIIIAIAEYQYQKQFTIDPMITLLATVFKIQTILK